MWILLVILVAGTIVMEWPMNPRKKRKGGKKGRDGKEGVD